MIIAVDTGGTKTLVSSFSHEGVTTHIAKFPTPENVELYVKHLGEILSSLDSTPEAVVVAMPGVVRDGILLQGGNISWHNFDLISRISPLLPNTPIYIENDANLAGLGEVRRLDQAVARVLYVTISTGIGGGMIVDGSIDQSFAHGEIGHMYLKHGKIYERYEHFASGRAIAERYHHFASDITDPKVWRDIVSDITEGFVAFMPIVRPELIIIGGSIGTYFDRYGDMLTTEVNSILPSYYQCPIVKAKFPEEAVIYGCYYYAVDQLTR